MTVKHRFKCLCKSFVQSTCLFEFSRNTQSWRSWYFCTTSNGNKLEIVKSPVSFEENLRLSECFRLKLRRLISLSSWVSNLSNTKSQYCKLFFKIFWRTGVRYMGQWYPFFGLLVMSPLGFKATVGSLICTWQWCTCYTLSEIHLWCDTCRPLGGQHTCEALVGLETGSYHATSHSVTSGRRSTNWAITANFTLPNLCVTGKLYRLLRVTVLKRVTVQSNDWRSQKRNVMRT